MTQPDLTTIYPDIEKAARITASGWQGTIDIDDAIQEISLALLADNYVENVIAMDPAARHTVLRKIGQHIATRYRTEYEVHSGNYRYGPGEVRGLLHHGALHDDQDSFDAGTADLRSAWPALNNRYQAALTARFLNGQDPGDSAERMRITRAIDTLTELMNRNVRSHAARGHDGPGARQAMSNSRAARVTHRGAHHRPRALPSIDVL
ncbi:hypothetical protein [Actinocrispum wychmicini]|uniref:Uncharacterized protein n=1 Tax=Actinocrispum wychmicini TaxID=1213861 RepID=A0A4R2JBL9_9PSEU|nr:hypothetical protein [Actinocrispum wychmicini]TCO56883.1 hypothetical protein EV192_106358 [Actinocrispum wychmicini]